MILLMRCVAVRPADAIHLVSTGARHDADHCTSRGRHVGHSQHARDRSHAGTSRWFLFSVIHLVHGPKGISFVVY